MSHYEFGHDVSIQPRTSNPVPAPELSPQFDTRPPGMAQSSDIQGGRTDILGRPPGSMPEYIQEFTLPGFLALDEAMKTYWSGIRVPTKDSYRFMRVKIAGGEKSVLFWRDELADGRVRLPVCSINRGSHEFNPEKFSPPYLPMRQKYLSNRLNLVAMVYRPVPFLVDFDMTIWASRKRDADYILYQILTRFNPLAEFTMQDDHIRGNVQLRFGGSTDASEKEAGFDQQAKVRYEFKMTAEAWLPLPETVVPTVLGHATVFREMESRELWLAAMGNYNRFIEPKSYVDQAVHPMFRVTSQDSGQN